MLPAILKDIITINILKMDEIIILYVQTASKPQSYEISPKDFNMWPRIASISWFFQSTLVNKLVKPIGFSIDPSTSIITGIENESAILFGFNLRDILNELIKCIEKAKFIIGHNVDFHLNVLNP